MVQQIRDARIKVTVDTEDAKRDIDLLRKSIGKESTSVGHIKSETKESEKKLESMLKGAQRAKSKLGRAFTAAGFRGMRMPDLYTAGINSMAAASAMAVNWIPLVGPPLGSLFRSFTRTALPFAEYGGVFMGEFMKGMVDASGGKIDELWNKMPGKAMMNMMLPGGMGIPMKSDVAVAALAEQVLRLSEGMTKLRITQANLEMTLKNVGTIAMTELAIPGLELDENFLKNTIGIEWRAGDASNSFRMSMEKKMRGQMGSALPSTLKDYFLGNEKRGQ